MADHEDDVDDAVPVATLGTVDAPAALLAWVTPDFECDAAPNDRAVTAMPSVSATVVRTLAMAVPIRVRWAGRRRVVGVAVFSMAAILRPRRKTDSKRS